MNSRIFLVGYMACGKTTRGKDLAKKLGYAFIDMDNYLEEKYNMTVPQIFAELGEETFRQYEHEVLKELLAKDKVVVATGGGAPCFHNNMALINERAKSVYLKISVGGLVVRLMNSRTERPLIKGKSKEELSAFIQQTLEYREQFYGQASFTAQSENLQTKDLLSFLQM